MEKVNQTFFLSHGSPRLSIDDTLEARDFFKSWSHKVFQHKPKSILVISAHWDTEFPSVNTVLRNSTIHDFNGFPEPMYKLKYEAPGAIELGKRVKELLMGGGGGMKRVDEDTNRGLDHGAWMPLMLMYPEADIPVCQLSVQSSQSGSYHYNMGKALAPLKEEGVLIIGSGGATHNLSKRGSNVFTDPSVSWALEFDLWLRDSLLQGRYGDVNDWEEKAPNPRMAHPWPEHLYPLHVAMGAAGDDAKAEQIHTSWTISNSVVEAKKDIIISFKCKKKSDCFSNIACQACVDCRCDNKLCRCHGFKEENGNPPVAPLPF